MLNNVNAVLEEIVQQFRITNDYQEVDNTLNAKSDLELALIIRQQWEDWLKVKPIYFHVQQSASKILLNRKIEEALSDE